MKIKITFIFVLIAGLIIFTSCGKNLKPSNIPSNAQWYGGSDGGYWIELISKTDTTTRFKIYNEEDGTLEVDADFLINPECKQAQIPNDIKGHINYFNLEEIYLDIQWNNQYCHFIPIKPFYGGRLQ